ncbi:hypothetical protein ACFYWX_44135 [Streptomyces sp. NPDC002888]|uniref:hypothetical protein n=1 Tax=Streptomyces sp. NPDC002888 TaxID=3364668 RepID=UPI00368E7FDB
MEFEAVISPGRHVTLPQGQSLKFSPTLVGRTVTVWASQRTVHVLLDGQLIRTRSMTFQPRRAIRRVGADGTFVVARQKLRPGVAHAGKTVTVATVGDCQPGPRRR